MVITRLCKEVICNHPSVWMNEEHRKMAMDILLSIGTNILERGAGSGGARILANGCLLLNLDMVVRRRTTELPGHYKEEWSMAKYPLMKKRIGKSSLGS